MFSVNCTISHYENVFEKQQMIADGATIAMRKFAECDVVNPRVQKENAQWDKVHVVIISVNQSQVLYLVKVLFKFVFSECVDGEEDKSNPCQPRSCVEGMWITAIVDCAEGFGMSCATGWKPPRGYCFMMPSTYCKLWDGECCKVCESDAITGTCLVSSSI